VRCCGPYEKNRNSISFDRNVCKNSTDGIFLCGFCLKTWAILQIEAVRRKAEASRTIKNWLKTSSSDLSAGLSLDSPTPMSGEAVSTGRGFVLRALRRSEVERDRDPGSAYSTLGP
jgi:hypothetical protein